MWAGLRSWNGGSPNSNLQELGVELDQYIEVSMLNQFTLTATTSVAIIGLMALLYGGVRFLQNH